MKTFLKLLIALALLTTSNPATAQEARIPSKPGWFVFNQNKVLPENVAKLNVLQDSLFAPILNELVDEGKLIGWGQLMHAWGDEWNYNFYFITESHRAFLDFWAEYISRLNKRHPGWFKKVALLFTEHKDNMFSIRAMR